MTHMALWRISYMAGGGAMEKHVAADDVPAVIAAIEKVERGRGGVVTAAVQVGKIERLGTVMLP